MINDMVNNKFIDLSHNLKNGMPFYPGTLPPDFNEVSTVEKNGFSERHLSMLSHTGTHIDFPAHLIKNGKTQSDYPIEMFIGKALKINIESNNDLSIDFIKHRIAISGMPDFILLSNGWDKYWGSDNYFEGFPLPNQKALEYICALNIKGIGIDSVSIDKVGSAELKNHFIVFEKKLFIIENLINLRDLPDYLFEFFCLPLKIEKGDGSPVRAFASIN
jgi:arylformamidase